MSLGLGLLCLAGYVALYFLGVRLGSFEFHVHTALSRFYSAINYSLLPLAVLAIISGHVSRGRLRQGGYCVGAIPAASGLALGYIAVLLFVMTSYLRDEPPKREGREDRAVNHLVSLHGVLNEFAKRHLSHTYPARLDQLLVGTDEYHNKLVEGRLLYADDPLDASPGYQYYYSPSTPAADGSITAYTILARPQKFGPGGRANFFVDESSVVRWASENRPATAGDPAWWEESYWEFRESNGYSVLPLQTKGDEILKKISVEYYPMPNPGTDLMQRLQPGQVLCLGESPVTATLHADSALAFGEASVPLGKYRLWIIKGTDNAWKLVINKQTNLPYCSLYLPDGNVASVPFRETAVLKPQTKTAFSLAREGDGFVVRIQLGEKELSANFFRNDDQPIAAFEKMIQFDPQRVDQPQSRAAADEDKRGGALAQAGKDNEAIAACEKAIQLDPKRFEYYKALDDLLSKRSEWQNVITLWTQFIALVSDNGMAYCERSGAYSHLHDLPNVLQDGDKACSLGDQECCENVKKFRSLNPSATAAPPGVTAPRDRAGLILPR